MLEKDKNLFLKTLTLWMSFWKDLRDIWTFLLHLSYSPFLRSQDIKFWAQCRTQRSEDPRPGEQCACYKGLCNVSYCLSCVHIMVEEWVGTIMWWEIINIRAGFYIFELSSEGELCARWLRGIWEDGDQPQKRLMAEMRALLPLI